MGEKQDQMASQGLGNDQCGSRDEQSVDATAALAKEQERAAFEAWYCAEAAQHGLAFAPADIAKLREGEGYRSDYGALNGRWEAWLALRPLIARAEAARNEGLTICREMVKAEDDLIADLQAEGRHYDVLKIDFPIMHRMRAFVARGAPCAEPAGGGL